MPMIKLAEHHYIDASSITGVWPRLDAGSTILAGGITRETVEDPGTILAIIAKALAPPDDPESIDACSTRSYGAMIRDFTDGHSLDKYAMQFPGSCARLVAAGKNHDALAASRNRAIDAERAADAEITRLAALCDLQGDYLAAARQRARRAERACRVIRQGARDNQAAQPQKAPEQSPQPCPLGALCDAPAACPVIKSMRELGGADAD